MDQSTGFIRFSAPDDSGSSTQCMLSTRLSTKAVHSDTKQSYR